ncbi:MAG: sodium-dependent transporter [Verrucomicrobia bacterium]|nr:sodium-dependent transporter [Verrucomicrobiota bacterium]MCH8511669.1 sodium-dependent transporter [Kiritimatiellia bacterium]
MSAPPHKDSWNTRFGVILAVTGSAVGLGNFLRFPGQAVQNGGGLFMVPYLIAFLIVGIPLAWSEWALGRYGGQLGKNSAPGIFRCLLRRKSGSYVGMLGTVMPVLIYTYYVILEGLCLYYAWHYLSGRIPALGNDAGEVTSFALNTLGYFENGHLFTPEGAELLLFVGFCFLLNFALIYRGLSRGIEKFCLYAMPLLVICAFLVLGRVLTLPPNPEAPDQNIINGLGFMWNPVQEEGGSILQTLSSPKVWVAATGQIFFSLSVGFGLILTYSSYLKKDDDVALSSLTSVAGNGFCEVVLGGMIAIPAAFIFLGPVFLSDPGNTGTFSLGFMTLPNVFNQMPAGGFFGFLFFFLLFLAAVTSSLSMLQPAIALLEEGLGITRKPSVAILGFVTFTGAFFVAFFSKGTNALDTIDFWMANFFIFIFATLQTLIFGWWIGRDKGYEALSNGAEIHVPKGIMHVIRYVSPTFLLVIFFFWCRDELPKEIKRMTDVEPGAPPVAMISVGFIFLVIAFFAFVIARANRHWQDTEQEAQP